MIKKIILIIAAALVAIALIKWIPAAIKKERDQQTEKAMEMEDQAQKRAEEIVDKKSDGRPSFPKAFSDKASDRATKAHQRSADKLRDMENDGDF